MEKNGWWINFIGIKYHYKNNILHNLDGPSVIWPDGYKQYWRYGYQCADWKEFFLEIAEQLIED